MQIFVRFAYGKVITLDVSKKATKVSDVRKEIIRQLNLNHPTLGKLEFQLQLTRPKTDAAKQEESKANPNVQIVPYDIIELLDDELLCKDNRITKNSIIDFVEKQSKLIIKLKYQTKNESDNKFIVSDELCEKYFDDTKIGEIKIDVERIAKINKHKQKLIFCNRELNNDSATLKSVGMARYRVIEYMFKVPEIKPGMTDAQKEETFKKIDDITVKINRHSTINEMVVWCYEKMVNLYIIKIKNTDKKIIADSSMKVRNVIKLAVGILPELAEVLLDKDYIDKCITLQVNDKAIENETPLSELVSNNTFTSNIREDYNELEPEIMFVKRPIS